VVVGRVAENFPLTAKRIAVGTPTPYPTHIVRGIGDRLTLTHLKDRSYSKSVSVKRLAQSDSKTDSL